MNNKALIDALRLCLPLAVERANDLRCRAQESVTRWGNDRHAIEYIRDLSNLAEAATHAVTAARLAIADAEAAAAEVHCRVAYTVTLRAELGGRWATHNVRVMAECADDAQAEALRRLEAAGIIHGDVLRIVRA